MAGSIHKQVLELAKKIGAPAVGSNVQETMKSINAYLDGTTHGANISDTVNEFKKVYSGGGGGEVKLEEKTADPSTSQQVITASAGYDGLKKVTISAVTSDIDSNITAENIKEGVEILGVEGSMKDHIGMWKNAFDPATTDDGYELDYNDGTIRPADDWYVTDFMPIDGADSFYIKRSNGALICYYNSQKEYIAYANRIGTALISDIPSGTAYIKYNAPISSKDQDGLFLHIPN